MDEQALGTAADRNLAATWALLGRHAGFILGTEQAITLSCSGLPIAFFNGAFAAGAVTDPGATIEAVRSFYSRHGVPYLLWVRDGVDDELLAAGRAAGLTDAGGPPLQVLSPIPPAPAPPSGLGVRLARTSADLEEHRAVVAAGFGMPIDVARRVLGDSLVDEEAVGIAIGSVDGVPVATALVCCTGTTAGVYNVATVPAHQGKGFGAAVTWAVVAEGARRGCDHAVLQASEAGHPVYRRMGFADLGRYVQLQGPPAT